MKLDNVDIELIRLLQKDSKKTTKQYADALHLSKTAVYERIRRLERNGVITQYTALVDKVKVGRDFMVLCQIRLVQHTKENVIKFEREVLQLKEVSECFHVGGDYDYILKIFVKDMKSYREFMLTKLTAIANIGNTQSSFVINEVKNSPSVHIQFFKSQESGVSGQLAVYNEQLPITESPNNQEPRHKTQDDN